MKACSALSSPFSARSGGLSASALRLIAMTAMLLDHLWIVLLPEVYWLHCVGRLAFPIFAFQIAEGFFHTRDRKKYLLRLAAFAVLSEVPFDLALYGKLFFSGRQNTLFTLLLGLFAVTMIDRGRSSDDPDDLFQGFAALTVSALFAACVQTDYGWKGVLTVVLFYALRGFRWAWLAQLGVMLALNLFCFSWSKVPLDGGIVRLPVQGLAVLALLPIWMYHGRKGGGGKPLQVISYLFYPLHLAALALLRAMLNG